MERVAVKNLSEENREPKLQARARQNPCREIREPVHFASETNWEAEAKEGRGGLRPKGRCAAHRGKALDTEGGERGRWWES